MEDSEQADSKLEWEALEVEAFKLAAEGRMLFALEKLDEATKLEERWYHHFYRAIWLWQLNKLAEAGKVVDRGLNFEKPKQFYFRHLSADMLFRVTVTTATTIQDVESTIGNLDRALREVDAREYLLFHNSREIEVSRQTLPKTLRDLYPTFLNSEDLTSEVRSLRTRIEMIRQSTILFKAVMETEKRVNAAVERNRERIDSERIRTIELLGIFTAILAFIFSGVQIFTRLPLSDALVLQVGIALIMIVFFLALHLTVEPEARRKSLVLVFALLLMLLLGLPLYARWLGNLSRSDAHKSTEVAEQKTAPVNQGGK
jgi:hypothetical protein